MFDMAADRTEMHNLAKDRPEDVKRLSAAWQAWADRCNVQPWVAPVKATTKPAAAGAE